MVKIVISPDNIELNVDTDENILKACLTQKLNLPHGCKSGRCGACKCKILRGAVRLDEYSSLVLTAEELEQGYTLLCKAHVIEDVELHLPNILNGHPIKMMPAKVESLNVMGNTAILSLKIPIFQKFSFNAGQYIDIMLQGKNRSYSIANGPHDLGRIELHIKYHAGGIFSEMVWNNLAVGSLLRFKGPLGSFSLQKTDKPIMMVCTGTGFAPIKAILEDMYENNNKRKIVLYWGNRSKKDFYLLDLFEKWQHKLDIQIKLCLSQDKQDGFISSYVTNLLVEDFSDLSEYELYACGNINMIEDVYKMSTEKLKLLKSNFFSDAFTPSA